MKNQNFPAIAVVPDGNSKKAAAAQEVSGKKVVARAIKISQNVIKT